MDERSDPYTNGAVPALERLGGDGAFLPFLAGWTVSLSALFALIAGELSSAGAYAARLVYWLTHIGAGLALLAVLSRLLQRAGWNRGPFWGQLLLTGVIGAAAFTPVAIVLEILLAPVIDLPGGDDWLAALHGGRLAGAVADEFAGMAPQFIGTWVAINLAYRALAPERRPEIGDEPPAPGPMPPAVPARKPGLPPASGLLARLPPELGQHLLLLKSDLNYLHVHTAAGKTMLLYSLQRAAAELGERGLLVHRSYWVAREAVVAVRKGRSGYICELANGVEVPVSRRRQAEILKLFGNNFRRAAGPELDRAE